MTLMDIPLLTVPASGDPGWNWRDDALCAQIDPEAWFPGKGEPARDAKRVCRSCPVRAECLEWALEHGEMFGVWGGLTERERRRALQSGRGATQVIAAELAIGQRAVDREVASAGEPGRQSGVTVSSGQQPAAAAVRVLSAVPSPAVQPSEEQVLAETFRREDSTMMEKAEAMEILISRFGYTAAVIAERTGLAHRTITDCLTLLDLDQASRNRIHDGLITAAAAISAIRQVRKQTLRLSA
jgi:WhiB family transcriptional regulator, redox-sensing transcriptional regulator